MGFCGIITLNKKENILADIFLPFLKMDLMNIVVGKKIFFIAIALIIVLASDFFIYQEWQLRDRYSMVYLATGEIYIGKLSTFPKFELNDAYLLQIVKDQADQSKSNFQLAPVKDAVWSPVKLYLNSKQIIFYGPISAGSKAAEALKNAKK